MPDDQNPAPAGVNQNPVTGTSPAADSQSTPVPNTPFIATTDEPSHLPQNPPQPPQTGQQPPTTSSVLEDIPPVVTPPPKRKIDKKIIGGVIAVLVLVVGLAAGLRLVQQQQEIREKAAELSPTPTPTPVIVQRTIEKIETRDDDGHITGLKNVEKCALDLGSACENSILLFPGEGDGDFLKVVKLDWEMHDHHEDQAYTVFVRLEDGEFKKLVPQTDITSGGQERPCIDNSIDKRKHPPGSEGPDSCFDNYSLNIGSKIDAVKIEFGCDKDDCSENSGAAHVHIRKVKWLVEEQAEPSLTILPTATTAPGVLSCKAISKDKSSPQIGDEVSFTCSANIPLGKEVSKYEFRYKIGNDDFKTLEPDAASSTKSKKLKIESAGSYTVQCRACDSQNLCTDWDALE